ncbi:MAG: diguanylate cyclase [Deltaproteobacteria bacterium]|nr:diguanylate cyclase [Deltaproteobacteria bacterium]
MRAVLRAPLRSLPSRIILSVFGAALVTSLAVALVSTSSIESFLRRKIDQKFPATLSSASERLDLWYAQRRLDIETFARSTTVIENAAHMNLAEGALKRGRATETLGQYLDYVLERFPQYEALLLLDDQGAEVLRVGTDLQLPPGLLLGMSQVAASSLGGVHPVPGGRVQVASSPIVDSGGRRLGSLHALIHGQAIVPVLYDDQMGEAGVIYIVDRSGRTLFQSSGSAPRADFPLALPAPGADTLVEDYTSSSGDHVVGRTLVVEESYDEAFAPVVAVIRRILGINLGIVMLFGLAAYQFARSIVRPIKALSEGARRIADGETDVVIPLPSSQDEIEVLIRVFNEMSQRLRKNQGELERSRMEIQRANGQLVSQNEELQRVNEVLEQLSITDGLTKLHNHRFFQDHLVGEMRRARRTGEPLALILIDIDDFKTLNDRHGHAAGDTVLREVAVEMNSVLREMDVLARYGGEEFALVASQTDLDGALALSEKIRLAVCEARFREDPAGGLRGAFRARRRGRAGYRDRVRGCGSVPG